MHMRCQARQLDSYSSARHCSTARQLLDRPRQTSTELDAQAHGVRLDRLDSNSTVTRQARQARPRQRLDSASTAPRQCLDGASTARQLDSQGSIGILGMWGTVRVHLDTGGSRDTLGTHGTHGRTRAHGSRIRWPGSRTGERSFSLLR